MRSAPLVSGVRVHRADDAHRARGILGWITADIDSVRVDGITLRTTLDGALVLGFPKHRGKDGTQFSTVRPRGEWERQEITRQLIAHVRAGGWLS